MGLFNGIGGAIGSLFNPQRGYNNAQNVSTQYYNDAQQQLNPYIQAGQDPAALQNQWAQSYQMSPYAKQLQSNATDAGLNSAGAMGLLGSSAAQNNIQQQTSEIANSDLHQYMSDLMAKFLAGQQAATQYGSNAMKQGENQAGLEYGKANAQGERLLEWLMMGGKVGAAAMTGNPLGGAGAATSGSTGGMFGGH